MKTLWFHLCDFLGLNALFRWLNRGRIKVLLFHNVIPAGSPFFYAIPPEIFDEMIVDLKRNYNLISIDQNGHWSDLRSDRVNLLISFDDGFSNNLTYALPVLQKHGVKALFFLIADCLAKGSVPEFIEGPDTNAPDSPYRTLTAAQAKQMADAGMTIGSHSMTHRDHRMLDEAEILADNRQARVMVSEAIGQPVNLFAFPWGFYTPGQDKQLSSEFSRIFLTRHGFAKPNDQFIPRNEVTDLAHMRVAASGLLDWMKALAGKESPY